MKSMKVIFYSRFFFTVAYRHPPMKRASNWWKSSLSTSSSSSFFPFHIVALICRVPYTPIHTPQVYDFIIPAHTLLESHNIMLIIVKIVINSHSKRFSFTEIKFQSIFQTPTERSWIYSFSIARALFLLYKNRCVGGCV